MEFLIIGVVSALNLIVIVHKFKKGRIEDGIFDSILFVVITTLFSGSYGGMVVAMIASLVISLYLWSSPPTFFKNTLKNKHVADTIMEVKCLLELDTTQEKHKNSDKKEELKFD